MSWSDKKFGLEKSNWEGEMIMFQWIVSLYMLHRRKSSPHSIGWKKDQLQQHKIEKGSDKSEKKPRELKWLEKLVTISSLSKENPNLHPPPKGDLSQPFLHHPWFWTFGWLISIQHNSVRPFYVCGKQSIVPEQRAGEILTPAIILRVLTKKRPHLDSKSSTFTFLKSLRKHASLDTFWKCLNAPL